MDANLTSVRESLALRRHPCRQRWRIFVGCLWCQASTSSWLVAERASNNFPKRNAEGWKKSSVVVRAVHLLLTPLSFSLAHDVEAHSTQYHDYTPHTSLTVLLIAAFASSGSECFLHRASPLPRHDFAHRYPLLKTRGAPVTRLNDTNRALHPVNAPQAMKRGSGLLSLLDLRGVRQKSRTTTAINAHLSLFSGRTNSKIPSCGAAFSCVDLSDCGSPHESLSGYKHYFAACHGRTMSNETSAYLQSSES